ncbi:MAG: hypothetical protein AABZ06_15075 [Bdellovibrionota bacterium]
MNTGTDLFCDLCNGEIQFLERFIDFSVAVMSFKRANVASVHESWGCSVICMSCADARGLFSAKSVQNLSEAARKMLVDELYRPTSILKNCTS